MKYLYKILRLFFCPHKYKILLEKDAIHTNGVKIGNYYDKECNYCGRVKEFRT